MREISLALLPASSRHVGDRKLSPSLAQLCPFSFRNVSSTPHHVLSVPSETALAQAFFTSLLDYCNSLPPTSQPLGSPSPCSATPNSWSHVTPLFKVSRSFALLREYMLKSSSWPERFHTWPFTCFTVQPQTERQARCACVHSTHA